MTPIDKAFAEAAQSLRRPEAELRAMAEPILASILHISLRESPTVIVTLSQVKDNKFTIEVDATIRERRRKPLKIKIP